MNIATVHQFPTPSKRRAPRVNSWRWNEDEDDAIDALPQECQIIYLRVFRKHMDYATGIVGIKRTISYGQIKERLEYQPPIHSNEKPQEYSQGQIKRLIQKLVDAGLAERLHDTAKGVAKMIFRLPMACADVEEARHERDTGSATRTNPDELRVDGGKRDMSATREARHPSGSPEHLTPLTTFEGDASGDSKTPSPKPLEYTQEFEAAWAAFPKRSGANPKRDAFKSWRARRAEGVAAADMIAGAERYAAFIRAKGDERSEFVMQAKRFFGTNAEYENEWIALAPRANAQGAQGGSHENRNPDSNRRAEQDRVAASLANPHDTSWADGLFDEGGAEGSDSGAGKPGFHQDGGDLPANVETFVFDERDAATRKTGACVIDGELVFAADTRGARYDD